MTGALATPTLLSAAGPRAERGALALPAGLTLALALAIGFMPMPRDPDLWFHLASGEYILQTHTVPHTDPFSLTRNGAEWVPHSWLFDVAVAESWQYLGPRATEAVFACFFALAILICFGIFTNEGVAPLAAAALALGVAIAAGNARGIRPQTVSLLLSAVVIALLLRQRSRPTRRFAVIVPLIFLLWAQVHAACIVGVILVAIWLGGRCVDALTARAWDAHRAELAPLGVGLGLGLLAVLITPHEITLFEYARLTAGLNAL
ncbi:MAG TPA: hypothetical protein P5572_13730, partial [Phycisphaerae bacterium]|nr:hypothetical protein [Phycisphaerae bacterium]